MRDRPYVAEAYFHGVTGKKDNGKSNGDRSVASPFGLRSGLRQNGNRFAVGFDAGLKPRSISETKAEADPPLREG
jgi:hypothetical protein